jgi:hypothetical protein
LETKTCNLNKVVVFDVKSYKACAIAKTSSKHMDLHKEILNYKVLMVFNDIETAAMTAGKK